MMRFFNYMEKKSIEKNQWTFVPNSEYNCVYLDMMKHKGKAVTLNDGTVIQKGDLVAEVHINSKAMRDTDVRMVFHILNAEFNAMGKAIVSQEEYADLKGIFGRTLLYPINKRLGFEVHEIRSKGLKLFIKIWDNLIKIAFSERKKGKTSIREPKEVWISREALIKKTHKLK